MADYANARIDELNLPYMLRRAGTENTSIMQPDSSELPGINDPNIPDVVRGAQVSGGGDDGGE